MPPVIPPGIFNSMGLVTKTLKMPAPMATALARAAKQRGLAESQLIREGIARILEADPGLDMKALIAPDLGVGEAPRDLSSSRRRMAGYGRTRHR
jgi:hypothetical protein